MYGLIRTDCSNSVTLVSIASMTVSTSAGMLEMTVQCAGVRTWKVKAALRSGWSKHAYTRWASATSNCE